jgi:hypothetical protein
MRAWRYFRLFHQWYILRVRGCTVKKRGWFLVVDGGKCAAGLSARTPQLRRAASGRQSGSLKANELTRGHDIGTPSV